MEFLPGPLAANTLLNDFRELTQLTAGKVLQSPAALAASVKQLLSSQRMLSTAIFNTHFNLCFNLFLLH